jgi:hypothetical protein
MIRLEHIEQAFKSAQRKIKVSLPHFQWKEVLVFLSFLLLSFIFWLMQSMQEEYEIQVEIPITYKDMPPDMIFVDDPPAAITARIRDKGSALLNYTLNHKKALIDVNVKDTSGSGRVIRLTTKDIEAILMKQLTSTTSILSFDPQQIEIPFSKLVKKELPVCFDGDIRTEQGFLVSGEIEITPSEVEVFAGDVVFDTLTSVRTVYTEIKDGDKTITRKLKLRKVGGATYIPDEVSVVIPIEEYTEKTFEIPVVCKNIPAGYTIRMFPATVKVSCNVPLSLFKDLSESAFSVEIPVVDLDRDISGALPVMLTRKPDWVDRVSLSPDSIEFILEQSR